MVATESELPQQAIQRRLAVARIGIVGNCVQPGFEDSVVAVEIGVETADAAVFFEEKDFGVESGESDGGGKPGEPAADDEERNLHPSGVLQQRFQVVRATVEGGETGVVGFRDLQLVTLAKFHNDIEKIHGIKVELIAERFVGIQIVKIRLVIYVVNNLQDKSLDIFSRHECLQII